MIEHEPSQSYLTDYLSRHLSFLVRNDVLQVR
nr:MAG TPA: hypothetical protein [Bacteriophage sp.]